MAIDKLVMTASLEELIDKVEEINEAIGNLSPTDSFELDVEINKALPSTVVNGKIIIVDSGGGNLYFDNKDTSSITTLKTNDIYVKYGEESSSCASTLLKSSTLNIKLYVIDFYKYSNKTFTNIKSNVYIGKNGKWEKINSNVYIFTNGTFPLVSMQSTYEYSADCSYSIDSLKNLFVEASLYNSSSYFVYGTKSKIDITKYSKIIIKGKFNAGSNGADIVFGIGSNNNGTGFTTSKTVSSNEGNIEITIDISKRTGSYYFKMHCYNNLVSSFEFDFTISEISLN